MTNQTRHTSWADVCAAGNTQKTNVGVNNSQKYISLNFATPVSTQRSQVIPLNKVVIPSPIKKAASRTNMLIDVNKNIPKTVDAGTQTNITMEDTLIAIMPTGNLIKLDGSINSITKNDDDSDYSSKLLANASVTAFTSVNDDDIETTKSEYISQQSRPPTRSLPTSASSSFHSTSRSSTTNNGYVRPPPGFEAYHEDAYIREEEIDDDYELINNNESLSMSKLKDKTNKTFSIWDGPSIGLGERILELIKTDNYKNSTFKENT